jgi:hypothetical protein
MPKLDLIKSSHASPENPTRQANRKTSFSHFANDFGSPNRRRASIDNYDNESTISGVLSIKKAARVNSQTQKGILRIRRNFGFNHFLNTLKFQVVKDQSVDHE